MKKFRDVVVIGSGLSAIGAIKALDAKGVKPLVIDIGERLPHESIDIQKELSAVSPSGWTEAQREALSYNPTNTKRLFSIPKKLNFGSNFFYARPTKKAPIESTNIFPPLSYAKGGLAEGWGSASMPPARSDIADWPISYDDLYNYYRLSISSEFFCANEDDLSSEFPILHENYKALELSEFDNLFLKKLKKITTNTKNILCGQARLLLNLDTNSLNVCRNCGECMSGCVYGSIYKPSLAIENFIHLNKIEYKDDCETLKIIKDNDRYEIVYFSQKRDTLDSFFANKVYLAAGAVNSTRIILNSLNSSKPATLYSRGGYVVPLFSIFKKRSIWPNTNTLPSIFMEMKDRILSNWVHIQISTNNELLIKRVKIFFKKWKSLRKLPALLVNQTSIAFINLHSTYSGRYELRLSPEKDELSILNVTYSQQKLPFLARFHLFLKLFILFIRTGNILLFPLARINSGTQHVGGSFPMSHEPKHDHETDTLGQLEGFENLHLIDSSILPNLPATTIGILCMANAYRIADLTTHNRDHK